MELSLVGINYQTAPLVVREKIAIGGDMIASPPMLKWSGHAGVVLSTCNRTEIYGAAGDDPGQSVQAAKDFLAARLGGGTAGPGDYIYVKYNEDAARHLFRVASGLDSMILGESEILGQVKQALELAQKAARLDLFLRHTFEGAIRTGRLVRRRTGINRSAVSVSSVAVELAARAVGNLAQSKMLVVGAGEAGALVARVARERGVREIVIASRTRERARTLAAAVGGIPVDFNSLAPELDDAAIIVTCAGAPHRILNAAKIGATMTARHGQPLVVIDIAVPRNVEPEVGAIPQVFLYNIDHLTGIAETNREQRQCHIEQAEKIVETELAKFMAWWHDFELKPIIGALMAGAEEIRRAQLDKTLRKLPPLSSEQRADLDAMTKSIITRILHEPIRYLRANGNSHHARVVAEMFNLNQGAAHES